jgi:hypothetical protein
MKMEKMLLGGILVKRWVFTMIVELAWIWQPFWDVAGVWYSGTGIFLPKSMIVEWSLTLMSPSPFIFVMFLLLLLLLKLMMFVREIEKEWINEWDMRYRKRKR